MKPFASSIKKTIIIIQNKSCRSFEINQVWFRTKLQTKRHQSVSKFCRIGQQLRLGQHMTRGREDEVTVIVGYDSLPRQRHVLLPSLLVTVGPPLTVDRSYVRLLRPTKPNSADNITLIILSFLFLFFFSFSLFLLLVLLLLSYLNLENCYDEGWAHAITYIDHRWEDG